MKYCIYSNNFDKNDGFYLQKGIYSLYKYKEKRELKDFIIFFEGIIYNLKEIKEMINVANNGTIEMILAILFKEYRDEIVNILDGAYSVVIIDKNNNITLFRDRDGMENLYYYKNEKNNSFIISNAIKDITKFIKSKVNTDILPKYFVFSQINDEKTFLKDIYRVKIFEILKYISGKWNSSMYNDFAYLPMEGKKLKDKFIENEIEEILTNRVKFLINAFPSDKINTLSGGVDSSIIQCILRKFNCNKSICVNFLN